MENKQEDKFQISKKQFEMILNHGKPTDDRNKMTIKGTEEVMAIFESKVNESETLEFDLKLTQKNGFIYLKQQRISTPYIKIDSYCRLCDKNDKTKYNFIIRNKPDDSSKFVGVEWNTFGSHNHQTKKHEIRGLDRKKLANFMVLENDGSSKKTRFVMLAADEDDENIPSEEVLRQIKHQEANATNELKKFRELNQVTKTAINNLDWYNLLKATAAGMSYSNIETLRDFPYFEMVLIMSKQLECINYVPQEDRIIHFDATGCLVDIPKR